MAPEKLFTLINGIGAVGYVLIWVVSPFWKWWDRAVIGLVCAVLAIIYCWMNAVDFQMQNIINFGSLDGVILDFKNKNLLNACWSHILVFDLLGSVWMKKNGNKHGIKHWMLLPALLMTCVLGPFGFLLYLLTRWVATKTYFAANE